MAKKLSLQFGRKDELVLLTTMHELSITFSVFNFKTVQSTLTGSEVRGYGQVALKNTFFEV